MVKSKFLLLLITSLLLIPFQNCSQFTSDSQKQPSSTKAAGGNGDTYEGKLVVSAPNTASPGSVLKVDVQGGQPPYNLESSSPLGRIEQINENTYQYHISSSEKVSHINLIVKDAALAQASTTVSILGVNRWFFNKPMALASLSKGSVSFIQNDGEELVLLDSEGRLLHRKQIFQNETQSGKISAMAANPNAEVLYLADSVHSAILSFNLTSKTLTPYKLLVPNCSVITRLIYLNSGELAYICEKKNELRFIDLDDGTTQELSLNSISKEPIISLQQTPRGFFISNSLGSFFEIDRFGSVLKSIKLQGWTPEKVKHHQLTQSLLLENGNVLVIGSMARFIYQLDEQGNITKYIGGRGRYLGQFSSLHSMALNDSFIITTDPGSGRISYFSLNGEFHHAFGFKSFAEGAFALPTGLSFDQKNFLHVLDTGNSRVQTYDDNGHLRKTTDSRITPLKAWVGVSHFSLGPLGEWIFTSKKVDVFQPSDNTNKSYDLQKLQVDHPGSSLLLPDGRLLVADPINHKVHAIKDGKILKSIGQQGFKYGEWRSPQDLELSPDKKQIFVLCRGSNEILVFDLKLNFIREFSGKDLAQVKQPLDMSFGPSGKIYLIDRFKNRFVVMDQQGNLIAEIGANNNSEGLFNSPRAIAVAPDGRIAVADTGNARVHIFPKLSDLLKTQQFSN